ncbi:MAG: PIG-L family deacetylase [Phycisphaerae bacterium]
MRFLCISPHPDDAELGMGGTLIKLHRQGHHVHICDMTNGEPTPNGTPEKREQEWTAAGKVMGVSRSCLYLTNRQVTHDLASRHTLAAKIREQRPDVMFIPWYPDAHPDHRAVHHIAMDARFDSQLSKTEIPGEPYRVPRVIQYFCTHLKASFQPTFVIDVSDEFETKMQACACYESQGLAGGLAVYVRNIHAYFGGRIGVKYAEPFYSDEVIGLNGLDQLVAVHGMGDIAKA